MSDQANSQTADGGQDNSHVVDETVFPNIKYGQRCLLPATVVWIVAYFAPGILLGQHTLLVIGLLWMLVGGLPFAAFAWRCFFPERLVADRDGFRIERPDSRRKSVLVSLGYEKLHEALWRKTSHAWRRALGPLIFMEPVWHQQPVGTHSLRITWAGPHIFLSQDEIGNLGEFVETLRKRNVPGIARKRAAAPNFFKG